MTAASARHDTSRGAVLRRVVVADDHSAICDLFALAMTPATGLTCVATATAADPLLAKVAEHRPDVVLLDISLGPHDGVALTRTLRQRCPDTAVVLMTGWPIDSVAAAALDSGASSLLQKVCPLSEVFETLRQAHPGMFTVPPRVLAQMAGRRDVPAPRSSLTAREQEVLEHLARGRDVRSISRDLGISIHTGRGHVKALLAKLGAHSQLEAVHRAQQQGLLT